MAKKPKIVLTEDDRLQILSQSLIDYINCGGNALITIADKDVSIVLQGVYHDDGRLYTIVESEGEPEIASTP